MPPSCQDPLLRRWRGDHRGGRRLGTRQPWSGRLGVVRRRRLLGLRRLAPRHQQHGRADGGPGPPPADRAPRRAAEGLLRQHLRHQHRHQVDGRLEAPRLAQGRRQAGDERRAGQGPRRRDGGTPGRARVGQGPRGPRAQRGGRPAGQRRRDGLPRRAYAGAWSRHARQRDRPPGRDRRPGRARGGPLLLPRRRGHPPRNRAEEPAGEPPVAGADVEVVSLDLVDHDTLRLGWRASADPAATVRSSTWVRAGGRWEEQPHRGTDEP